MRSEVAARFMVAITSPTTAEDLIQSSSLKVCGSSGKAGEAAERFSVSPRGIFPTDGLIVTSWNN
jgi:hypothetical protein